jgi:DNA polymerase-1
MIALIDADALCFRMAVVVEDVHPFTGEVLSADMEEAFRLCQLRLKEVETYLFNEFGEDVDIELHFSDKTNFRYRVNEDYKSNRKGLSKPIIYSELVEKCKRHYDWIQYKDVEADDSMGMHQLENDSCIVSPDKDMKQIAGYHLNLNRIDDGVDLGGRRIIKKFFLTQCIAGDSCDGYKGAVGFGMGKAKKWLDTHGYTWSSVVDAYKSCSSPKSQRIKKPNGKYRIKKLTPFNLGLGEKEALETARMAFILNSFDYYDIEKQEVKLWEP